MSYREQISKILDRTNSRCHLCGIKVFSKNYGKMGERGAWEVDHSRSKAMNGSEHGNNLFAACIPCNRSKGKTSSGKFRKHTGRSARPLSKNQRASNQISNSIGGASVGAIIGSTLGPGGWMLGALVGGLLGSEVDPG